MTCRRSQVRVLYRPPKQEPLTLVRGFFVASSTNPRRSRTVQDSNRAAAHSAVSKATVRLCLARGSQRLGMSTKRDADHSVWGLFSWWRYRTRTARPRRRRGNKHPSGVFVSARFPMRRNVYRDDCRFVVDGTGLEQGGSAKQSKQSAQCHDDDRSQRLKQGGVVGAAF